MWDTWWRGRKEWGRVAVAGKGLSAGQSFTPPALFLRGFVFPCFFLPDVFHLVFTSVYPLLYCCFTLGNKQTTPKSYHLGDPIYITPVQEEALGAVMKAPENINHMPSCFTNSLCLIAERNNHFKIVEWGQIFHYFLIPFLIEIRQSSSPPVQASDEAMEMLHLLIKGDLLFTGY